MEKGDIASWASTRMVIVLEGVLATPLYKGGIRKKLRPPEEWNWEILPLKKSIDLVERANVAIEVVTFIDQEVADRAAEFLLKYDVPVSEVSYVEFDWFCRSLVWRPDVTNVIDSDPSRYARYGQKGYAVQRGTEF